MSKSAGQNPPQDLRQILFDKLNEHGYLFREKCAQTLQDNQRTTKWEVLVEEYPVSTVSRDARIDFVLKDTSPRRPRFETYAIVECKRVNPSRGYWLFGNPTIPQFDSPLLINVTSQGGTRGLAPIVHFVQLRPQLDMRAYLIDNWWLQITKKNESKKGVEYNSSPDPIEIALSQVCVGVSGLAQELATNLNGDFSALSVVYIPVVITSAPLYVAEYDVADVNLASGDIEQDKIHFGGAGGKPEQVEWLMVDYGVSRTISPERLIRMTEGISPAEIEDYHKRSVLVVNSNHIIDFFARLHVP